MRRYFTKIVGSDEMNVLKLRDVLNANFKKGTTSRYFLDTLKVMIYSFDMFINKKVCHIS